MTRACTNCRRVKCKCTHSEWSPEKCVRCIRLNKECVPHVSRQGQRPKKAVNAVNKSSDAPLMVPLETVSMGSSSFGSRADNQTVVDVQSRLQAFSSLPRPVDNANSLPNCTFLNSNSCQLQPAVPPVPPRAPLLAQALQSILQMSNGQKLSNHSSLHCNLAPVQSNIRANQPQDPRISALHHPSGPTNLANTSTAATDTVSLEAVLLFLGRLNALGSSTTASVPLRSETSTLVNAPAPANSFGAAIHPSASGNIQQQHHQEWQHLWLQRLLKQWHQVKQNLLTPSQQALGRTPNDTDQNVGQRLQGLEILAQAVQQRLSQGTYEQMGAAGRRKDSARSSVNKTREKSKGTKSNHSKKRSNHDDESRPDFRDVKFKKPKQGPPRPKECLPSSSQNLVAQMQQVPEPQPQEAFGPQEQPLVMQKHLPSSSTGRTTQR